MVTLGKSLVVSLGLYLGKSLLVSLGHCGGKSLLVSLVCVVGKSLIFFEHLEKIGSFIYLKMQN